MDAITIVLISAISISCVLFYGLTVFMHHEIKGSAYQNVPELLILSGCWVFAKSYFYKNNESKFIVARLCLVVITLSFFTLYKLHA